MMRTYRKEKTVGFGYWGRVITLLLLPLLLSIYTFTAAVAQEVAPGQQFWATQVLHSNAEHESATYRDRRELVTSIPNLFKHGITGPVHQSNTLGVYFPSYKQRKLAGSRLHSGWRFDLPPPLSGTATPVNQVVLASNGSGGITGRVTDSTGAGIQGVWVYIVNSSEDWITGVYTDTDGNYTVTGIPVGTYKIEFMGIYAGYINEWYNNKPDNESADFVSVTASNITAGIDAILEPGGRISGRVTDSSGTGIQNVRVDVFDANGWWISVASTDAGGNYTVIGIPTSTYKVKFGGSHLGCVDEWYDNKSNWSNAVPVSVNAPETTAGIDAVLEIGGSISGRVTDFSGTGIQNAWIVVYDTNGWGIAYASTGATGFYTVNGVPTGQHKVEFYGDSLGYVNEWYNDKSNEGEADPVIVTAPSTTSGIDAVLEIGGSISGRVTDSSGVGIQNVGVDVYDVNGEWISWGATDANGNYSAIGIPTGAYKVEFYGSHLGYLYELYNNKLDFCNADPVAVTAPNATTGIDAVLELGGSISGRITDSTGTGIQNVWIDIIDTNDEWISYASTDANGNYTAIGIPTGAYKVSFYGSDLGYVHEWYNNKPDIGNADTVAVTAPNATAGIDAILEVGGSISGRVTDLTGTGIQNVYIAIINTNGEWISWASTDANGNYTAGGVPTGAHKVRFYDWYLGYYVNEWYNNKPDFGTADTVTVTVPNATIGIDAVLEPGGSGSISGRITDSNGAGIRDVWVKVYDTSWRSRGLWFMPDADGNYKADGLPTGQYKVQFFYYGCSGYLSEWYNNKPDSASADTVAVTVPNATVGIDAVLSVQTWFEENDPAITYTGTWSNYTCASCSGGALKISNKTGAKATFTFNGTGAKWIAAKANQLGKAKVYVDGVYKTTIDLYSAASKVKQVVAQVTGLTPGSHTITIVVTGQNNTSSTGFYIDIDAFEVVP